MSLSPRMIRKTLNERGRAADYALILSGHPNPTIKGGVYRVVGWSSGHHPPPWPHDPAYAACECVALVPAGPGQTDDDTLLVVPYADVVPLFAPDRAADILADVDDDDEDIDEDDA